MHRYTSKLSNLLLFFHLLCQLLTSIVYSDSYGPTNFPFLPQNDNLDTNSAVNVSPIDAINDNGFILKTGTTIVGICCPQSRAVVLGADSRSTGGSIVMDKEKLKIHQIAPRIYACGAGTSADCEQLTRKTSHKLALERIDHDMCGSSYHFDRVAFAKKSLISFIKKPESRSPHAVFVLGGVDDVDGASLYNIDSDGSAQQVSYAALGSGSVAALASLESSILRYGENKPFTVDFAVSAVRSAIQSGILNDLGSGSHVDLCVIELDGVQRWRERLLLKPNHLPSAANLTSFNSSVAHSPEQISAQNHGDVFNSSILGEIIFKRKNSNPLSSGYKQTSSNNVDDLYVGGASIENFF